MRKPFSDQLRFDCQAISQVQLNLQCRDEIIPILRALQHIYSLPQVREKILHCVAQDVNRDSSCARGRKGLDYWQIVVLAAVRLGCNLDYDKLQDLAEQHRALRQIMGIGDWEEDFNFNWRRIRDNLCLIQPATLEEINHVIIAEAHQLEPHAAKKLRADSFVVETNIHYPTESSLILDGIRKTIELCVELATPGGIGGWRQHQHLLQQVKKLAREIARVASRKGAHYKRRLKNLYRKLLGRANAILLRAKGLCDFHGETSAFSLINVALLSQLKVFIHRTEWVCGPGFVIWARRRVLEDQQVPNEEKLFSIFEPHTQLYKRGKAGQPIQWGRLLLVYEDAAGFIVHYHLLDRSAQDRDVVVEQTRILQNRLGGQIEEASFDRGFHSPENQRELLEILPEPCLPMPGRNQSSRQTENATVKFQKACRRHSGIESAIGCLQSGNSLKRCRDRSELGFERYIGLAILGRNLHTLGKRLLADEDDLCPAAQSKRSAG